MSTIPTEYAKINRFDSGYWGREYRNGILVVTASGSIISNNGDDKNGVRPAMWVKYGEAVEETKAEEKKTIEEEKIINNIDYKWTKLIENAVSLEEIHNAYDILGTIKFGKYEQDGNIDNGKEDIEWYVINCGLQYDDKSIKEENKYLLLSKYALEYMVPDGKKILNEYSYEKSNVRKWLNNNFYENAFEEEEKKIIIECEKKKIYFKKIRNIFEEIRNKDKTKYMDKVQTLNYSYLPGVWFDYRDVQPMKYIIKKYGIDSYDAKDIFDYYNIGCINKKMGIRPVIWINVKNNKKLEQEINNIIKVSDLLDIILKYKNTVKFGKNEWIVCEKKDGKVLLRSKNAISHEGFLGSRWNDSFLRKIILHQNFYNNFSDEEKLLIEKNIYEDKFISLRLKSEQSIKSEDYIFLPYNIFDDYFEIYDTVNFMWEDINNKTDSEYKDLNFICMDGTKKNGERSEPDVVPYIWVKYKIDNY